MIQIIREIGIFIVIAQAVLYFVPGESYVKYVKVIIGIIMIARMAQPLLLFVNGQEWERMLEEMPDIRSFSEVEMSVPDKDGSSGIERSIGRELQEKLNKDPAQGYRVRSVEISCLGEGEGNIAVAVEQESKNEGKIKIGRITVKENAEEDGEMLRLKEHYGRTLGIEPERIKITME